MPNRKARKSTSGEFVHFEGCAGKCKAGKKVTSAVAKRFMDGIMELADSLNLCVSAGFEHSNRKVPLWERKRART